jgi:methyl-accepting chemotaxis protein
MPYLQQFTIRARLLFTALLAVVALLIVGLTGALSIRDCVAALEALSGGELRAQAHLLDLRKHMGDLRRFEKDALLNIDDVDASKGYQRRWTATLAAAGQELDALRETPHREAAQAARVALDRYGAAAAVIIQRVINGQIVTAGEANQALGPAKKDIGVAEKQVEALAEAISRSAEQREAEVAGMARSRLAVIVTAGAAAGGVMVAIMLLTIVSITRPLGRAIQVADRVSAGDLSQPVEAPGRDEVSALLRALQRMQAGLHDLVEQVRQSTETIQTASAEVACGSQDLSNRTELTASRLQETASSVEHLHGAVQSTAGSTRRAHDLAQQATAAAHQGGDAVQRVRASIEQIHAQSQRIADITGVIDGLAVQTNLLALNAAWRPRVPASRAAASRWWPPRCASWRAAVPMPPARSAP